MAARKRDPRPRQQQTENQVAKGKKIYPVDSGLKSVETAKIYRWHFETFLKYLAAKYAISFTAEKLKQLSVPEIEGLIIEYLDDHMNKQKHLKHATINTAMAAILHFCTINDVWLNREKISKFIPEDENHETDRAYTRKEIEELLKKSDERFRVVILLMVNGMRVGAIPELEARDLEPKWIGTNGEILANASASVGIDKVYKILVYARSKKHKYYTFVTPECTKAIDEYLQYRRSFGEQIQISNNSKDSNSNNSSIKSPLIREQFNFKDNLATANPRKMSLGSLEKTFERTLKRAGLKTIGSVMRTHGFRKFAITMMKKAKVDFSDREYLVGHKVSRGLDVNYDRPEEDDRLVEWSKAINNLTIDKSLHLEKKLQRLEGETDQEIARLKWQEGQHVEIAREQAQEITKLKARLELQERFANDYLETAKSLTDYIERNKSKLVNG